jgi:putative transposase
VLTDHCPEDQALSGSIRLRPCDRKALLRVCRRGTDPDRRLRAHVRLLLDDGHPGALIAAVLVTRSSTINRWRRRYSGGGLDAVLTHPSRGRRSGWPALVVRMALTFTPGDFGFVRGRGTCEAVAVARGEEYRLGVGRETARRWRHRAGPVYRRPRPVLGPKAPDRAAKLRRLRQLPAGLPAGEVAVFQDEVDVSTNPKIGARWMRRGAQAAVVTPGNTVKRYLSGSRNWRTGELALTEGKPGQGRNTELFLADLDDLRRRYRRYRVIHVICDNAKPHVAARVREYLTRWGHRVRLHYLPTYAPEGNPIERVWWHLHEEVTRNHRCRDIDDLLDMVFDWLGVRSPFEVETSAYDAKAAAGPLSDERGAI